MALQHVAEILKTHQHRGRSHFFELVREIAAYGSPGYNLISSAYNAASEAHHEQYRDGGARYIEHPRAVAIIQMRYMHIIEPKVISGGLTHDVPEDCDRWPVEMLREHVGVEVASLSDWCNKRRFDLVKSEFGKAEALRRYHENLLHCAPREAIQCKLPDRLHNLVSMWSWTPEEIERKAFETESYYLPIAKKHDLLYYELEEAVHLLRQGTHLLPPENGTGSSTSAEGK